MTLPDLRPLLVLWLAAMNLVDFLLMGWDKSCARKGRRRVPEKMLFLPALSRRGVMTRTVVPELLRLGLTARGAYGEGSGAEGDLFQISNEVTLGVSEEEILTIVGKAVEFAGMGVIEAIGEELPILMAKTQKDETND